jgi:hypothetical protein
MMSLPPSRSRPQLTIAPPVSDWTPINVPTGRHEVSYQARIPGVSNETAGEERANLSLSMSERVRKTGRFLFTSEERNRIVKWMIKENAAGVVGHEQAFQALITELGFEDSSLVPQEKTLIRQKAAHKIKDLVDIFVGKQALTYTQEKKRGVLIADYAPWTATWLHPEWDGKLTKPDGYHAVHRIEEDLGPEDLGPEVLEVEALTEKEDEVPAYELDVYMRPYVNDLDCTIAYRVFQLNPYNYDTFTRQFQAICQREGIWDVFVGNTTYPSPPIEPVGVDTAEDRDIAQGYETACRIYEEEKKEFVIKQRKCLGWLFSTIGEDTREALVGYTEPLEVLEILADGIDVVDIRALVAKIGELLKKYKSQMI